MVQPPPIQLMIAVVQRQGTQTIFHIQDILEGGNTAPTADGNGDIRLIGRHAMPHVFHTNDFIKMIKPLGEQALYLDTPDSQQNTQF